MAERYTNREFETATVHLVSDGGMTVSHPAIEL